MSLPRRAPRSLALLRALSVGVAIALAAYSGAARAQDEWGPLACRTVFVSANPGNALGSKLVSPDVRGALDAIFKKYGLREVGSTGAADIVLTLGAGVSGRPAASRNRTYFYPELTAVTELSSRYGGEKQEARRTYVSSQNRLDAGTAASSALALWPGSSKAFLDSAVAPLIERAMRDLATGVLIVSEPPGAAIEQKGGALHSALLDGAAAKTPKFLGCFPAGAEVHVRLTLDGYEPAEATLRTDPGGASKPIRLTRMPVTPRPGRPTTSSEVPETGEGRPAPETTPQTATQTAALSTSSDTTPPWLWALGALVGVGALAAVLLLGARKRERAPGPPEPTTVGDSEGRAELRRLLEYAIKSDADLSAFCFDYFDKEVYRDFSDGMERSQKITILMRDVPHCEIRKRLAERFPDEVAAFERGEGGSP
jgi:hypothetical protein